MSKKVSVKLNLKGINEVMKSPEINEKLQDAADAVAAAAGDGYATRAATVDYIGLCTVYPDTKEAVKDNYDNNSLLKALGSIGLPTHKK